MVTDRDRNVADFGMLLLARENVVPAEDERIEEVAGCSCKRR